ncbi:MAG: peptidoglycan recognition family protein [Sandaracinaceae bacterium]
MRLRLLLVSCLLVACTEPGELLPTPPDRVPEVSYGDLEDVLSALEGGQLTPRLDTPLGATRVSALLRLVEPTDEAPLIQARGFDEQGVAGPWVDAGVTWREDAQIVVVANLGYVASEAQLRLPMDASDRIARMTWTAVVPAHEYEPEVNAEARLPEPLEDNTATDDTDVAASRQALSAELTALGVVPRETWGSRSTSCSANASKARIAIHHTVSNGMGDPAANVRGIQAFHMDSRGWCDIGYHFLVSLDGQVFEARQVDRLGAHVGGHNTGNIGVSFMGCFHPTSDCASLPPQVPPEAMIEAGATIVAGLADIYGITVTTDTVKGHRDHTGASTACPGDNLHARLVDLRNGSAVPGMNYGAQYVSQSFPLASQPFELSTGQEQSGYIELRNIGTETWRPSEVFLAPTEPRNTASPLAGPDWISASRAATVDRVVPTGEVGRFNFTIRAPNVPGVTSQYFGLIREGLAWFSDPGQGGPPDDQLQVLLTTVEGPPRDAGPPPMTDAGPLPPTPDGGPPPSADAGTTLPDGGTRPGLESGCGCRAVGSSSTSGFWLVLLALPLLRRRRRIG